MEAEIRGNEGGENMRAEKERNVSVGGGEGACWSIGDINRKMERSHYIIISRRLIGSSRWRQTKNLACDER